jgi:hypothetical protein
VIPEHCTYAAMEQALYLIAAALDESSWRDEAVKVSSGPENRSGVPVLRVRDAQGRLFRVDVHPEAN